MRIVKASAGSGKTYLLSETYRKILLDADDPYAYRHILAVTFTNKATAEMKSRILRDLARDAETNVKAKTILTDILHDYTSFTISTIDKFFQRVLKSFSREIGYFASYQIELDRDAVINEAMDRILDSLTDDDSELLRWIRATVGEILESGGSVKLEEKLYEMGKFLKNEEHRQMVEEYGLKESEMYSKEVVSQKKKACRKVIAEFEKACRSLGYVCEKGKQYTVPGVRKMKANPQLEQLFNDGYKDYLTACIVDKTLFSLGLAGEFYQQFDAILKEKNVMCLDESKSILRDIINGSDAPFVYEKIGVRYRNFLLDEFQDTSNMEWCNFLPLLRESESGSVGEECAAKNLIVGDVKQSIYRWRNSDWRLLGEQLQRDFPYAAAEPKMENWRSCRSVVDFNGDLFEEIAGRLGLRNLYEGVRQSVKSDDPQSGEVRISFCDDQIDATLKSIESVRKRGAGYSDIAVLVRNNTEGKKIADALVSNGVPVISNDSLDVKSSLTVRRIVSLLTCIDNPEDTVSTYLGTSLGVEYPKNHESLVGLCESLVRELMKSDPEVVRKDNLYVQSFEDEIQNWTALNGNDLRGFLRHWKEGRFFLSSPDVDDAVTVITIHKSKGLEFPHVIFPFAEKVSCYKADVHWCRLDTNGTNLDKALDGIYPVLLAKETEKSCFCEYYQKEREMQLIDNINVLYVALTRAEKSLHVIAATPTEACRKRFREDSGEFSNFAELIYRHCGGMDEMRFGEPYDFSVMVRKTERKSDQLSVKYDSIALNGRLIPSEDAMDFFGEDGTVGVEASGRLKGVALHNILSRVDELSDLEKAVSASVLSGELTESQGQDAFDLLNERISAHLQWFSNEGRNEVSIIDTKGDLYRPDRVVATPSETVVIDYKFGTKKDSYSRQVARYVRLYRQMGFNNVKGFIWYVPSDEVEQVPE